MTDLVITRVFDAPRPMVYRAFVDPGTHVPRFIQNFITRRSLPNLLLATKKRIESGGRYHK